METSSILQSQGKNLYENLLAFIDNNTKEICQGGKLSLSPAFDIAGHIMKDFSQSTDLLENAVFFYESEDIYKSHALNVAIFSFKMAQDMNLPAEEMQDILIAGLYHDVGFGKLLDFLQYEGIDASSEKAKKEVQKHPLIGYHNISCQNNREKRIAEIILQHHERADGSGYPNRLEEHQQMLPAKIISIADTYESLIHPRSYRDALIPPRGMQAILQQKGGAFSQNLIKTLISSFSMYPVGYYVRLNTKQVGKVLKTYQDNPLRPDVEVLFDRLGNRLDTPKIVKLIENPLISIEECVPGFAIK